MTAGSDLDDFRGLLAKAFDERVVAWTAEAEAQERFPRQLIEHLGVCGVFDAKWATDARPDVGKLVELAFALGQLASAGIGVGVSLHDSAIAILRRFGKSDYLRDICDQAIRGAAVLCIGASEESGGSDLQIVETEIRSRDGGFEVRGVKKFVSLSPIADHIMVVARSVDHDPTSRHGNVAVVAVPAAQVSVQSPTARSVRDRWIPPRSASTPGYRPMHWLRGPARGWQPSVGDWLMSGCRSPGRSQRRVNGRSESPWPA